MSPVRILILLGLFYLLYRLLINAGKKEDGGEAAGAGMPASDVLKEDPVCHVLVPARQATVLNNNGETLYFCSDACRSKYLISQGDQP